MSLNHHRVEQLLSAYLDGELLAPDTAQVQDHLLECAVCREAHDRLRATKSLVGGLPVAEPSAEFWAGVRAPAAHPPVRTPHRPVRRILMRRGMAWAAAAAIVVLALALTPWIKGAADRLHAAEIGVDLYVREHAIQMSAEPLSDRAYLGVVAGDSDLVLVSSPGRAPGAP